MATIVPVSVGINGFGPSGRAVFFAALDDSAIAVTAINDPSFSTEYVAYVLEHEWQQYTATAVSVELSTNDVLVVNGQKVSVTHTHDYRSLDWGGRQVQFVVECSGVNTTRERCWTHVNAGATGVIVCAQSADAPVVVPAINDSKLCEALPVVCAGAGVGSVLAPLVELLERSVGIEELSFTAVQGPQPIDAASGRSSDRREWRQARLSSSGASAIVPHDNTGVNTLNKVFPQLRGKIVGSVLQVPVQRGCAVDLVVRTAAAVSKEQLDELLTQASNQEPYSASLEVRRPSDLYISSDCVRSRKVMYDSQTSQTMESGRTHKLLLWVDTDMAYAQRVLMLVRSAFGSMENKRMS